MNYIKKLLLLEQIKYHERLETAARKLLISVLIVLLTVYGPVELTRVIYHWGIVGQFRFEIAFMWVLYVAAMGLVWRLAR